MPVDLSSLNAEFKKFGINLQSEADNSALFYIAERNPAIFGDVLQLYPKQSRIEVLGKRNHNHETVLHCAANVDVVQKILQEYEESEWPLVIEKTDFAGNNVLHRQARNFPVLQYLLNLYPQSKQKDLIFTVNKTYNTLLHIASHTKQSIELLLNLLSDDELLPALTCRNNFGVPVIHYIAEVSENLSAIFARVSLENLRYLMGIKDQFGENLLNRILKSSSTNMKSFLQTLPKEVLLSELHNKNIYGQTIFHLLKSRPDSLKAVLEIIPTSAERYEVLQQKNNRGESVIDYWFKYLMPSDLELFNLLELPEISKILQTKFDYNGNTLLHLIAKNSLALTTLLSITSFESIASLFDITNIEGNTVYFECWSSPEILKNILLSHPNPRAVIETCNNAGNNLLHMSNFWNPAPFKILLDFYSPEALLEKLLPTNKDNTTVLRLASTRPDVLLLILNKLPNEQKFSLIQKLETDIYFFYRMASIKEAFLALLAAYPIEMRHEILLKSEKYYPSVIRFCYNNHPEMIPEILELLPIEKRLEVLSAKDVENNSVLSIADLDTLIPILQKLTVSQRNAAMQIEKPDGSTLMGVIKKQANTVKVIETLLNEPESQSLRGSFSFFANNDKESTEVKPVAMEVEGDNDCLDNGYIII